MKKIEQLNDFTQQTTNYGALPKIQPKKQLTPLQKSDTSDSLEAFYQTKWVRFKNSFKPFPVLKVTQNKRESKDENKFIQYHKSPLLRQSSMNLKNKLNVSSTKQLSIEDSIKVASTCRNPKSQNVSNQLIVDSILLSPSQYQKKISFLQEEVKQIRQNCRFKQPSIKFDLVKNLGKYLELNYDFNRLGVRGVALEEDVAEFDQYGVQQKKRKFKTTEDRLQDLIGSKKHLTKPY